MEPRYANKREVVRHGQNEHPLIPDRDAGKGQLVGLLSYLGCLTCSQEMQASVNVLTLRRLCQCHVYVYRGRPL